MAVERVAFLSSEYPPHTFGGLGTTVEALSRYLGAAGVKVILLLPDVPGYADPPPGVRLVPVPVDGAVSDADYWLSYCESSLDTARRTGLCADLVHCHDWMTALGGLAIGQAFDVPVLFSVHLPQTTATNLALEDLGIAGSDGVLVNSHAVRTELAARTGQDIWVVPNGVDLSRFSPPGDRASRSDQILFVGRLVPQKGVDVLLRAFGAVLRRHPEAKLVIAGDGQQRLYLERLARFLGVRQRVSFVGWQSAADLAELYRSSTVTAVPSLYEPFGLVALEAMACGSPVVAGRVGGLAELVEDGVSGFTVEAGDHLDLATRLAELLSNPDRARALGLAARRRAELYDWATIADRTNRRYERLASRARSSRRRPREREFVRQLASNADDDVRARALALMSSEPATDCTIPALDAGSRQGDLHGR